MLDRQTDNIHVHVPDREVARLLGVPADAEPQDDMIEESAWIYAFSEKALKRWARELLHVEIGEDGTVYARVKYHGALCSYIHPNLVLDFKVTLSRLANGWQIDKATCVSAEEDEGVELMCGTQSSPSTFLVDLAAYEPLAGHPLVDVLQWNPEMNPAGCVCTRSRHDDKWLMVYQTILYRLRNEEDSVVFGIGQETKVGNE